MKIQTASPLYIYELGQRPNQEDSLWPPLAPSGAQQAKATGVADSVSSPPGEVWRGLKDTSTFIVCDGMGGHEHGEVASQAVTKAIGNYLAEHTHEGEALDDGVINDAIQEAYNQLDALDTDDGGRKMGTTLTLLCLHRNGATMAHIGDSRIYHLRTEKGNEGMLYLSRDHSLVMEMYLAGELRRDEKETYEKKNVITRAMQPHQERRARPDIVHTTNIRKGDYFFLCSDGITEKLSDAELLNILCAELTDEEKMRRIEKVTTEANDNHTAWLIRIESVENEPSDDNARHDEDTSRANFLVVERSVIDEEEDDMEHTSDEDCNADKDESSGEEEGWISQILKKLF